MKIKGVVREQKKNKARSKMPKHGVYIRDLDVIEINPLTIKRKKGDKNGRKQQRKEKEHVSNMAR